MTSKSKTKTENPIKPEAEEMPEVEEATPDLQTQLEAAQAESAKNFDGWQRALAELANYKKRQIEQNSRYRIDSVSGIISQIFPVLDDLDLAMQNIPQSLTEQEQNWVQGFELVQRKLIKVLEDNKVEAIDISGEFDPNLHEAVTHEDSPDHESNAIIAELRKGYKLENRVLRPSLVRVAK